MVDEALLLGTAPSASAAAAGAVVVGGAGCETEASLIRITPFLSHSFNIEINEALETMIASNKTTGQAGVAYKKVMDRTAKEDRTGVEGVARCSAAKLWA